MNHKLRTASRVKPPSIKKHKHKQISRIITNLSLVGHNVNEVVCSHVIHVWDENGQEVRVVVLGVDVFLNSFVPVLPTT